MKSVLAKQESRDAFDVDRCNLGLAKHERYGRVSLDVEQTDVDGYANGLQACI